MLHIYNTPDEVLHATAQQFVELAKEAIDNRGRFTVALSGGNSPRGLYELLASEMYKKQVEWNKVYFFMGDERYVPVDHPESNALMVKNTLFDPLHISSLQYFFVNTKLDPREAAGDYQKTIEKFFAGKEVRFDLVLLGLGDNSHTASLFPGTNVLDVKDAGVKEVYLNDQQIYRITMTAPLINQSHHIAFLVFGSSKAEAVHHILKDEKDYKKYPAQLIQPKDGEVSWFLDEAAASMLAH